MVNIDGKIRILYIVSTLKNGGPTNQLYGIIRNLDKKKYIAKLITLSHIQDKKIENKFNDLELDISSLNLSKIKMQLLGKIALKKLVEEFNPDVIHTTGIRADLYTNKWLNAYTHCCSVRSYAYDDYVAKYGRIKGLYMANQHMRCISQVQYPVSCSYSIANKLETRHKIKSTVIQNGIDLDRFINCNFKSKNEARKALNLPQDKTMFLFIGALIDLKNPEFLVEAFKKANIEDDAILVFLGTGELYAKLKRFKYNNIFFIGRVENVPEYLYASDYFVSPSKSEGLPNVVLEALASGLKVLLSDIDPHKEIINNNDSAGEVFSLNNINELVSLFSKYVTKKSQEFNIPSRELVERSFTSQIMSQKYQELYDDIYNNSLKVD